MAGPQPVVPNGYDIYLDTFFRLNSERHNGEGQIGSIPTMKIVDYANWLDIDNISNFIEIITRVDVAYVNEIAKQIKKQMQQVSKGA